MYFGLALNNSSTVEDLTNIKRPLDYYLSKGHIVNSMWSWIWWRHRY